MSKNVEDKLGDELRTLGTILEVLALPIFITVNVLRVVPNQDHGVINVLSVVAVLLFFTGLMLHHLPSESQKKRKKGKSFTIDTYDEKLKVKKCQMYSTFGF